MQFRRTRDFDEVHGILTYPSIYHAMGDDFLPAPADFHVNRHPQIWYVTVSTAAALVGLFSLFPLNMVCWEIHVAMLPWAKTEEKWEAAHELVPWLGKNTRCKRLVASVPASNKRALMYGVHGLGLKYVGRQPKAFLRGGRLEDLVLMGRAVTEQEMDKEGGVLCQASSQVS